MNKLITQLKLFYVDKLQASNLSIPIKPSTNHFSDLKKGDDLPKNA
jgi:hypothetical protein